MAIYYMAIKYPNKDLIIEDITKYKNPKEIPCYNVNKVTYNCPCCGRNVIHKKSKIVEYSEKTYPDSYPKDYIFYCHTCKSKYYSKTVLEKREKVWMDKYGVDNPSKNKEVHKKQLESLSKIDNKQKEERRRKTCLEKYGVNNPMELPITLEKRKKTWIDKYGVENVAQLDEVKKIAREKGRTISHYLFEGQHFDSSWELQFYRYLKDNDISFIYKPEPLVYEYNGRNHLYFPDFLVEGEYVEIKGDHLIGPDGKLSLPDFMYDAKLQEKYNKKQLCMDYYKVQLLSSKALKPIIRENTIKYGRDWYKQFRVKKEVKYAK